MLSPTPSPHWRPFPFTAPSQILNGGHLYLGQELGEQGDEVLCQLHLVIGLDLPLFWG